MPAIIVIATAAAAACSVSPLAEAAAEVEEVEEKAAAAAAAVAAAVEAAAAAAAAKTAWKEFNRVKLFVLCVSSTQRTKRLLKSTRARQHIGGLHEPDEAITPNRILYSQQ